MHRRLLCRLRKLATRVKPFPKRKNHFIPNICAHHCCLLQIYTLAHTKTSNQARTAGGQLRNLLGIGPVLAKALRKRHLVVPGERDTGAGGLAEHALPLPPTLSSLGGAHSEIALLDLTFPLLPRRCYRVLVDE